MAKCEMSFILIVLDKEAYRFSEMDEPGERAADIEPPDTRVQLPDRRSAGGQIREIPQRTLRAEGYTRAGDQLQFRQHDRELLPRDRLPKQRQRSLRDSARPLQGAGLLVSGIF